jgi:hypothetical protein
VETFGGQYIHWVCASVSARDPVIFTFQPEMVEENVAP